MLDRYGKKLLFKFSTMSTYDVMRSNEKISKTGIIERIAGLTSGGTSMAVASANQMTPLRKAKQKDH